MKNVKKSISIFLVFVFLTANIFTTTFVSAEETTVTATNVLMLDLLNGDYAYHPSYPGNTSKSNLFTQTYTKNGTDYNFDKVASYKVRLRLECRPTHKLPQGKVCTLPKRGQSFQI